ncbi:MAG: hypothetical protein WC188_03625 [Candidatus Caldatribacteriota bacterium]
MSFFGGFFGDGNLDNIDTNIDNLISSLPKSVKTNISDNISSDFINEFINESPQSEIDRLFQSVSISRERLERYNVYDETYKYVPIIKRIMSVYIANILQKNPINGKCLLVKDSDKLKDKNIDIETLIKAKKIVHDCLDNYDILLKLRKKILPNMLLYGDCCVEVVNINKEAKKKIDNTTTNFMPIFEAEHSNISRNVEQLQLQKDKLPNYVVTNKIDQYLSQICEYYVNFIEDFAGETKKQEDEISFDNILLKLHRPHNIVILETDFGSTLGYLVISKDETPQAINLTQSLSTLVGRITTLGSLDPRNSESVISDKLVKYILKTILVKSQKSNKINSAENIDDILAGLPSEVYQYVKRLFIEHGINQKSGYNRLKVRFVSTKDMAVFTVPSSQYDPYGQSFVDSLIFPCKLYILSQLSNIIIKLSRAAPVRKWTIDVGQTQMQAGMIQKMKRELYNSRITLDDLNSFKSIPKILSDFKDMFVLSKGGQKAIDVEVASHGDPTVRVADLEDARREIMSLSGIPPAYLGYADVIELREQLVHTNVAFATEISDIQEGISASLTKLVDIIGRQLGLEFTISDYVTIQLIPPIILMLQVIETSLSSIGNITGTFQTLQISADPFFLLEKYIPYIDWEAFKASAKKYKTLVKTEAELDAANGSG